MVRHDTWGDCQQHPRVFNHNYTRIEGYISLAVEIEQVHYGIVKTPFAATTHQKVLRLMKHYWMESLRYILYVHVGPFRDVQVNA